jgi:alkyl hydroperoxide reductase subunit AhpC
MESKASCCSTTTKAHNAGCQCGDNCKCGDNCQCGKSTVNAQVGSNVQVAQVRKPAPYFEAEAYYNGFKKVKLTDYKGKYVVLFFWPLDFTFVCPTEIISFGDKAKEFREIGAEVVGVSIDSKFTHMEYCKKDRKKGGLGKMDIPLLADVTKSISKNYGCLIDEGEDAGVAFRATYIIDGNGILRHQSISDLPVGRNVDEVLRLVKAFKYTDEFGEVCPASWKPGQATIVPDEVDSAKNAEYWEKEHATK